MSSSVDDVVETVPLIAIHGVGRHVPGDIEQALQQTIGSSLDVSVAVSEFNWDRFVDHRTVLSPIDALRSLERVCADFHATAIAAISVRRQGLDARLSRLQQRACALLRRAMAFTLAGLFALPAVVIVVFLLPLILQIGQPFWTDDVRWLAGWLLMALGAVATVASLAILGCGVARAVIQRSLASVRSAITCVVLTLVTPIWRASARRCR